MHEAPALWVFRLRGLQPDWAGNYSPASNDVRSKTGPFSVSTLELGADP